MSAAKAGRLVRRNALEKETVSTDSIEVDRISALPRVPAVYALCGRRGENNIAYVGTTGNLRRRIEEHLEFRTSSVTGGMAAVAIMPERIGEVRWWTDLSFAEKPALEAAELLAFDALNPTLRSRAGVSAEASARAAEPAFRARIGALLAGPPSGRLVIPTLSVALERIAALERQADEFRARLHQLEAGEQPRRHGTAPPPNGGGAVGQRTD